MNNYITVVIKYREEQEQPCFHADMHVLGGVVESVMFDDALAKLEAAEDFILEMGERDE